MESAGAEFDESSMGASGPSSGRSVALAGKARECGQGAVWRRRSFRAARQVAAESAQRRQRGGADSQDACGQVKGVRASATVAPHEAITYLENHRGTCGMRRRDGSAFAGRLWQRRSPAKSLAFEVRPQAPRLPLENGLRRPHRRPARLALSDRYRRPSLSCRHYASMFRLCQSSY